MPVEEDAIAPVVAIMLILAVIVTFMAVYNSTFLPSLKEQAEIEHLADVEEAFLKFAADMENAVSLGRDDFVIKERIPLGGGEIMLNSLKSGGTLRVQNESYPLIVVDAGGTVYNSTLVNISYEPVDNFWTDQGYSWQYGYVNVTKGTKTTPLEYTTMDALRERINTGAGPAVLATSFIDIDAWSSTGVNCTNITVDLVSFSAGESAFTSGNGIGTLELDSHIIETSHNVSSLSFTIPDNLLLNFSDIVADEVENACKNLNETYGNIDYEKIGETTHMLNMADPDSRPLIEIRQLEITVSAL